MEGGREQGLQEKGEAEEDMCARQGQGRSLQGKESKGMRKSMVRVISPCHCLWTRVDKWSSFSCLWCLKLVVL